MGSGWPEVSINCGFQFLSLTHTPCFRMKKWNVSCESYGNRWKVEDVVGVLVDMDLLEMKFFINGADMGPAFTNFQSSGLFPAISLNVRQCLRVNYGQELFIYPLILLMECHFVLFAMLYIGKSAFKKIVSLLKVYNVQYLRPIHPNALPLYNLKV